MDIWTQGAKLSRLVAGAQENPIVVYGGTFFPPHNGHVLTASNLTQLGHVIVVPSAGHEFKPKSRATYAMRKVMARHAFGERVGSIEDLIDLHDERRAFLVMSKLREIGHTDEIVFAIGPDIDPASWTGYPETIAAGFKFIGVPELGVGLRSTQIRALLAAGSFEQARQYVPAQVMDYIVSETSQAFWSEHA